MRELIVLILNEKKNKYFTWVVLRPKGLDNVSKPYMAHLKKKTFIVTRPDTRPPVADGWAGAEMRVFPLFDSITSTDRPTNQPTDRPTDQPTDGRTKPLIELRVRN